MQESPPVSSSWVGEGGGSPQYACASAVDGFSLNSSSGLFIFWGKGEAKCVLILHAPTEYK